MQVLDTQTGELVEVQSGSDIAQGYLSGRLRIPADATVYVSDPTSDAGDQALSFEQAAPLLQQGQFLKTEEEFAQQQQHAEMEAPGTYAEAFGRGALRGAAPVEFAAKKLTEKFGQSDFVDEQLARSAELRESHPITSAIGEGAGFLASLAATGGASLIGKAGTAAGAGLAARGVGIAGQTAGKYAAIGALENAAASVNSQLADAALHDAPLTVESFVPQLLIEGIIGGGIGAIGGAAVGAVRARKAAKGTEDLKPNGLIDAYFNKFHKEQAAGQGALGVARHNAKNWLHLSPKESLRFENQLKPEMRNELLDRIIAGDFKDKGAVSARQTVETMREAVGNEIGSIRKGLDAEIRNNGLQNAMWIDARQFSQWFNEKIVAEWKLDPVSNAEKIAFADKLFTKELRDKGRLSLAKVQEMASNYRQKAHFRKETGIVGTAEETAKEAVYRDVYRALTEQADRATEQALAMFPQHSPKVPWKELKQGYAMWRELDDALINAAPKLAKAEGGSFKKDFGIMEGLLGAALSGNPVVGLAASAGKIALNKGVDFVTSGDFASAIVRKRMKAAMQAAGAAADTRNAWRGRIQTLLTRKGLTKDTTWPAVLKAVRSQFKDEKDRPDDYFALRGLVDHLGQRSNIIQDALDHFPEIADEYPELAIQVGTKLKQYLTFVQQKLPIAAVKPTVFAPKPALAPSQKRDFVDYMRGMLAPESVLDNPAPQAVLALKTHHPETWAMIQQTLSEEAAAMAARGEKPQMATLMKLALLTGTALTPTMTPEFTASMQDMYADKEEQAAQASTKDAGKSKIPSNSLTTNQKLAGGFKYAALS